VVEKGIPVIDPRLAVRLAEVVRRSVVQTAGLRASAGGRETKAREVFDYILSDHFVERFRGLAESVEGLRGHQAKERQWHEDMWEKQSKLHAEIEGRRREIGARLSSITEKPRSSLRVVGAQSYGPQPGE
jgi:hypothetical protein